MQKIPSGVEAATNATGQSAPESADHALDLVCFSHLRWHFVTQRLLTRCARDRRVFFWEEPYFDADETNSSIPTLEVMHEEDQLWVLRPHLPRAGDASRMQRALLKQFLSDFAVNQYALRYHTPMALEFTMAPRPNTIVYDCMDELSGFLGAPAEITRKEMLLFEQADVVFTGDMSLYEAKKKQHYNVHAFPSSIDVDPFAKARTELKEPSDQASIAHPRAGFFGVLDERFDHALLNKVASARPEV